MDDHKIFVFSVLVEKDMDIQVIFLREMLRQKLDFCLREGKTIKGKISQVLRKYVSVLLLLLHSFHEFDYLNQAFLI